MAIINRSDIEAYSGMAYTDFKVGDRTMTEEEWVRFIDQNIPRVNQVMCRFCNTISFEPLLISELHNGRGATDDDASTLDYNESDKTYYLREVYLTNDTYDPVVVEEDTASPTQIPNWVTRTVRSASVAGDYQIITEKELTSILFHDNIPAKGTKNIRFTYTTGYDPTSSQFLDIKLQQLRLFTNLLLTKKKIQEAVTIRNYGTRDYSQMFDVFNESAILAEVNKHYLEQYRRYRLPGGLMFE